MMKEGSVGVDTLLQSKGVDMRRQEAEGCEIDKDYWEAQEARYNQHISQGDLFSNEEMQKQIYQDTQLSLLDTSQ